MTEALKQFATHTAMLGVGFGAAQVPSGGDPAEALQDNLLVMEEITPELCLVNINKIEGEDLYFTTQGNVKVEWSEGRISEDADFTVPLSQIPTQDYLDLSTAPFLANLKTNKFYPSDSYAAGCVAPHNRRLFDTKDAAVSAGFIPSKAVK